MPVVHPADIWRASGRYDAIGPELTRFKDRNGRDMVLAMTHEEVVGLLLADIVRSLAPAPAAGLPLPDQVARRATRARRADPRPRVRDEGRLQRRSRPGRPRRQLRGAVRRVWPDLRAARPRDGRRRSDVGIMGGSQAHEFMVLNPAGEDVLVLCEAGHYAANRQVAVMPKPDARRRGAAAARGGRDARDDDDRHPGGLPRDRPRADRQGRLLRDRRRPPGDRHRARRLRGQRDEARQRGQGGRWHPARDGRGDQGGRDGARLRLADRGQRHGRRHRRPRRTLTEPRRGGEPRGVPLPERQRRPRLHRRRHRRHHERPGGRRLPGLRGAGHPAQRDRGRQHLQARARSSPTPPAPPTSARTAVAHPIIMGSYGIGVGRNGLHRRGPPRREGDRLAGRGRPVRRAPGLHRRRKEPASTRSPSGSTSSRSMRVARSCGTTATSRPA